MSRKEFLLNEMAKIQAEITDLNQDEKQKAFEEISKIVEQMETLYAKAEKLASKHDIQFYFHSGYEQFIVDKDENWESSRC